MEVIKLCNVLHRMTNHFLHKRHLLTLLHNDKLLPTFLANFEEGVHCHFLHTREGFVHKLEEFENHCSQEFPMCSQKPRVLANNIHDVACHDGLVLFATLHLAQTEQILDHRHEETLFILLMHGATNRTDGPAQTVQKRRRPTFSTLSKGLLAKLLQHDGLHVFGIQVCQIDKRFPNHFVQSYLVRVFLLRTDNVALFVLLDGYFGRLGHLRDQDASHL
mmetsp:Transcript_94703/g.187646  ORF Transcript_94703/g.187646 Transcript_94703/m.187646 type:complete len:219 (-) Transcript_94703:1408-2064(-)